MKLVPINHQLDKALLGGPLGKLTTERLEAYARERVDFLTWQRLQVIGEMRRLQTLHRDLGRELARARRSLPDSGR